jgi:hypothetical protein
MPYICANRAAEGLLPKSQSLRHPIQPKQLRRLHALWHRWTRKLRFSHEADRQLRHYYIGIITQGQATETKELTEREAALVIEWLAKLARLAEAHQNYAAGTAGREGYPEQRQVLPSGAAWRALWGCATALGMERSDLNSFIRRHYGGAGLRGLADLRTMADVNRVLWGLKAMLRRRAATNCFHHAGNRAA